MKRLITIGIAVLTIMALAVPVLAGEPDPGVGNVNFTVMNLDSAESAQVLAQYVSSGVGAGGEAGTVDAEIPATIGALSSSGFPIADSGLPDNWSGSVVVSSDKGVAAFAQMRWENPAIPTDHPRWRTAGAYNGFIEAADTLYLPSLAQRVGAQYSRIAVQSADAPSVTEMVPFTITFYDRAGNVSGTITDEVNRGAQKTYDLSEIGGMIPDLGDPWLGSAVIEADDGDQLAAAATMHWVNYSAAYSAVLGGGTEIFLPSYTRRMPMGEGTPWFQYTGIVVQNLDEAAADVTVYWYDRDGNELHSFDDTIPARSAHGYNTRFIEDSQIPTPPAEFAAAIGFDQNGSVRIVSDGAEIVAVANLQWTENHPSSAAASAYTSFSDGDALVFAPQTFRRVSNDTWLQYTGLIVQNVGDAACTFDVTWVDRETDETLLSFTDTLQPGIAHGYNTRVPSDIPAGNDPADLGVDYRGAVTFDAEGCDLAAIHNTLWTAWTDNTTYNAFGQ